MNLRDQGLFNTAPLRYQLKKKKRERVCGLMCSVNATMET